MLIVYDLVKNEISFGEEEGESLKKIEKLVREIFEGKEEGEAYILREFLEFARARGISGEGKIWIRTAKVREFCQRKGIGFSSFMRWLDDLGVFYKEKGKRVVRRSIKGTVFSFYVLKEEKMEEIIGEKTRLIEVWISLPSSLMLTFRQPSPEVVKVEIEEDEFGFKNFKLWGSKLSSIKRTATLLMEKEKKLIELFEELKKLSKKEVAR